ncbi:MAG TPA: aminotransferase class V-fold PLP-dependent enzyme [Nocardioides sp.]|uniref:pyridoxal phosphate-dependent decarboxylase family protein n=1 Tax=Nocardioides sp. TaxID=35761 RepID=UPI002ED83A8F
MEARLPVESVRAATNGTLEKALRHALVWLESLDERPVAPLATAPQVADALGRRLPEGPSDAGDVLDLLVTACEPGLTAMPSGRFYGMVIGGSHPAALAADWLTGAWDQNTGLRRLTPATAAVEEVAAAWLLDLLGLDADAAVGFPTSATTANLTCLAAARDAVLRRTGHDVAQDGLASAPRVRVLTGAEGHESVGYALRYLGLGAPEQVPADDQGRLDPDALRAALGRGSGPSIVVLQAGNVHSGAFDPFGPAIEAAHEGGAWVHVDGAFGLFAAAAPGLRHLTSGFEEADSWATDAHKTLNVPYDCGVAIVKDASAARAATGKHGDYLILDQQGDPFDHVPELSRRARGVPVWAVLRALGRRGVGELVEGMARHARTFADGVRTIPGAQVLNEVVYTQACVWFGGDERTEEVVGRLLADGTTWMSGSRWHGRSVLRISVSNWATTDADVERSLVALRRCAAAAQGSRRT